MCESCAVGAYPAGDGSCISCPVVGGSWLRVRGLVFLLVGVVGASLAIYLVLLLFVRFVGGSISTALKDVSILVIWSLQMIQVVSQVSRVSSTSIPALLRAVYNAVALIQLQGVVLHPVSVEAC